MASPWERMKAKQSALPSGYKGPQPGGITSVAPSARATYYSDPVEKMRGKYFDNRQDVSRDRLERRLAQQQENIFNRLTMFKPVEGTGGTLLQSRTPGGPSIADVYEASAREYGPTPSELLSDIKYGAGKMFKGLGDFVLSGGVTGRSHRHRGTGVRIPVHPLRQPCETVATGSGRRLLSRPLPFAGYKFTAISLDPAMPNGIKAAWHVLN